MLAHFISTWFWIFDVYSLGADLAPYSYIQPTLSAIYNRNGNVEQNHILVSKLGFVLKVLAATAVPDLTFLRPSICHSSDKKLLNFKAEISNGVLWRAGGLLQRAASASSPSVNLLYSELQREGNQMLVALCHSFTMQGLLLGIWLLLLDGRELCLNISGGRIRGMSSFCCTSVVVTPHSQLLTVRSQSLFIS